MVDVYIISDTLSGVDFFNEHHPRADRLWQASDTLKNVVVALTQPTGERELLVIRLPVGGDGKGVAFAVCA